MYNLKLKTLHSQLIRSLLALLAALWPHTTRAECGATFGFPDVNCHVEVARYQMGYSLAGTFWGVNRSLLMLVYQLEQLRYWLVQVAFESAYAALTALIDPLLVPAAILAVLLGCLLFLALPLLGRIQLINIRQVLSWVIIAPLLLAQAGSALAVVEYQRWQVGNQIAAAASGQNVRGLFGQPAGDMAEVTRLYPTDRCGQRLARPSLFQADVSATTPGLPAERLDDLAAALLYADASDIHCPQVNGVRAEVPHRFFERPAPNYAIEHISSVAPDDSVTRASYADAITAGGNRLALGLIPTTLAAVEAFIQLLFTLSLVTLWAAVPLAALVVFFQQDLAALIVLVRRAVGIVLSSWLISFILGLLFTCLIAAAQVGNAAAFIGFAIGGLALAIWMLFVAIDTLKQSLGALTAVLGSGLGIALDAPLRQTSAMVQRSIYAATALDQRASGAVQRRASQAGAGVVRRLRSRSKVGDVAGQMPGLQPTTDTQSNP